MLPLPPVPQVGRGRLRHLVRRLDAYTLWAFNAQPPLVRGHIRPNAEPQRETVG
jgi:hypothetical protein